MYVSTQLLILCLLCALTLPSIIYLLMRAQLKILETTLTNLQLTLKSRESTIESLFNRLQAGDLKTLLSLQAVNEPLPEQQYIPRTDKNELEILGSAEGLGQEHYDDGTAAEFTDVLAEFGAFEFPEGQPRG
jgi:hypothetical protein